MQAIDADLADSIRQHRPPSLIAGRSPDRTSA